jgi:hypothetical protein
MSVQFLIGADPEVFVRKNGKPLSAYGMIEGTKDSPKKTSNGAVQVDGMALEFNIDPTPYRDFNAFNFNIVKTVRDLKELAGGVTLVPEPVQEFGKEFMDAQPDAAKELGCDPDFNAYTGEENPRPDGDRPFRTGAGHVHVGWGEGIPVDNPEHFEICQGFVKMLDATVGLYMAYIDRDPRRRELYGKAGAFRVKPYGVEYRTPSNVWIKNKARRQMMHYMINRAIDEHIKGNGPEQLYNVTQDEVREIIDSGDWERAHNILDVYFIGWRPGDGRRLWRAIKKEMEKVAAPKGE